MPDDEVPTSEDLSSDIALLDEGSDDLPEVSAPEDDVEIKTLDEDTSSPIKDEEEEEVKEEEDTEVEIKAEEDDLDVELSEDDYIGIEYKEIKKAFPEVFKKFPALKQVFWREKGYTQVYPTVEDARESKRRLEVMGPIEEDLFDRGSSLTLLKNLHEVNPQAAERVIALFTESVKAYNHQAYHLILTPVLTELIETLHGEGTRAGGKDGDNLKNTALVISHFTGIQPQPQREPDPQLQERERQLSQREQSQANATRTRVARHVSVNCKNNVDRLIAQRLEGDQFNSFTLSAISNQVSQRVGRVLSADERHMGLMNNLWKKAAESSFSEADVNNIIKTYVHRAKSILPSIIKSVKSEALRTSKPRKVSRTSTIPPKGRESKKAPPSKEDLSKMTDLEILES